MKSAKSPFDVPAAIFLIVSSILLIASTFLPAAQDCFNIAPATFIVFYCYAECIFDPFFRDTTLELRSVFRPAWE
jgi:hypothetical protein